MSFVHLHLHTDSSLLDGMIQIERLVERAKQLDQKAVAVTDHGWIAGAVKLVQAAEKAGIKPIIGSELYMTTAGSMEEKAEGAGDQLHLTVLAMNEAGYQNLTRLTTEAHIRGFSYRPRVDRAALERHSEGLIVMSGCWGAEVPTTIREDIWKHGKLTKQTSKVIEWWQRVFGDRFYLEVMCHGEANGIAHVNEKSPDGETILDENDLNRALYDLSQKYGIPLIATNDAHYLEKEDGPAQDALLCLGTGGFVTKEGRLRFPGVEYGDFQFYVKGADEMREASDLGWWADACDRTQEVADRIEDGVLQLKQQVMPTFDIPEHERLALKVWMETGTLI